MDKRGQSEKLQAESGWSATNVALKFPHLIYLFGKMFAECGPRLLFFAGNYFSPHFFFPP